MRDVSPPFYEVGMAKTVDQLIDEVIAREGGYVNHPADRGGATNWGVTEAVARQNGFTGAMQKLSRSAAVEIYRNLYWLRPRFDDVAKVMPRLAAELFDTGINMGTGTAALFLQRALNALNQRGTDYPDLTLDRNIGGATLSALSAFQKKRGKDAESVLVKAVEALQGSHYLRLAEATPSQEAFVYGWLHHRIGNTQGDKS
jgi:lysozyme family protein